MLNGKLVICFYFSSIYRQCFRFMCKDCQDIEEILEIYGFSPWSQRHMQIRT